MTIPDIKRGGPFPNGLEQQEAQLLGPYPTWRTWRHVVEKEFGLSFKDSHIPEESALHEFYIIRRLHQKKGSIDRTEVERFWREVEEDFPTFEEKWSRVVEFIVKNTPIKSVKRP